MKFEITDCDIATSVKERMVEKLTEMMLEKYSDEIIKILDSTQFIEQVISLLRKTGPEEITRQIVKMIAAGGAEAVMKELEN